jgi:hypothetical protein
MPRRLRSWSAARTYTIGLEIITQVNHDSGDILHFLHDGHGSTRALLDGAAAIVETYSYDAFGEAIGFDPSVALTTWLFAGDGQYDPTNGLVNHLARWRQGHLFLSRVL